MRRQARAQELHQPSQVAQRAAVRWLTKARTMTLGPGPLPCTTTLLTDAHGRSVVCHTCLTAGYKRHSFSSWLHSSSGRSCAPPGSKLHVQHALLEGENVS